MAKTKARRGPPLKDYHFSLGNTNKGAVGFCAVVRSTSKAKAVEILRSSIPEDYETYMEENDETGSLEYVTFYTNTNRITVKDIDDVEKVEYCDDCKAPLPRSGCIGCPDGAEICQDCFDAGRH